MKICSKCKVEKSLSEFGKRSASKDGLYQSCGSCRKENRAQYYIANKDAISAKHAEYRAANIDKETARHSAYCAVNAAKLKAYHIEYRAANVDATRVRNARYRASNAYKLRVKASQYYAANKDKISLYHAKRYAANPEIKRIHKHTRRARLRSAGGTLSKGITAHLYKLQNGLCACCGKSLGDKYHLDHIMPIALGGTNTDDNVQLLTPRCNSQKGAKHPEEFAMIRLNEHLMNYRVCEDAV
jgi:5-methylcytosine-specific restriction endonuclease McrA